MTGEGKISERQLTFIMVTVLLATVLFFAPQLVSRSVEQDAWITAIIATLLGLINVLVIVYLGRRFPGLTIIEYLPLILGKPLGKLLAILYCFWFLFINAFIIRTVGIFLNTTFMPNTPVGVFDVTMVALTFFALRSGLEVWARVNEILLPIIILALLAVITLPLPDMDFRRLLPIGVHPVGILVLSSFISASWRGEIFAVGMFLPSLNREQHMVRNLIIGALLVGVILGLVEIATVAVFGGTNTGQLEFPFFSLARVISLAKIFDRMEIVIVMTWVIGTFIKICVFLYSATKGITQVVGFKNFQYILFPIALLSVALADNIVPDVAQITDFMTNVWGAYGLLSFELVIPVLLLLVTVIRGKKRLNNEA
ncbi:MAG: GerAB/ArcD/ProY family transporter [Chitinophagales bacterium]